MTTDSIYSRLSDLQTKSLAAGVAGLGISVIGAFWNPRQFFVSYLFGYLVWLGLALGCLGFLMIHHLTGGRWGFPIRRFYEAAIMTIPVMAILFIPICFGIRYLYLWTDSRAVAADPILSHRAGYMNTPAFIIRAALFFIIWSIAALFLNKWSLEQDRTASVEPTIRLRTISGPGIMFYPLTATFVLVDWVLSLEPDWFSTMFLVLIVISQMLSALAFAILLLAWLGKCDPYSKVVTPTHFHHLGMLLLAFVMLWTYMAFSQYLITYSGNLPHEIVWYRHRLAGSWIFVVWFIFLFHFLVPFFLLLSRALKQDPRKLAAVALLVFIAHAVDMYWLVAPSFAPTGIQIHWLDIAAPIGIGGIWLSVFAARLAAHPLLVLNDPRPNSPHAA